MCKKWTLGLSGKKHLSSGQEPKINKSWIGDAELKFDFMNWPIRMCYNPMHSSLPLESMQITFCGHFTVSSFFRGSVLSEWPNEWEWQWSALCSLLGILTLYETSCVISLFRCPSALAFFLTLYWLTYWITTAQQEQSFDHKWNLVFSPSPTNAADHHPLLVNRQLVKLNFIT